jgi:hypothetical protein
MDILIYSEGGRVYREISNVFFSLDSKPRFVGELFGGVDPTPCPPAGLGMAL